MNMPTDGVLVIEDNRAMQRTLRRMFESDGLRVRIASDGVSGLENFRRQPPEIVILDLKLPGLPGRELCRVFKAQEPSIPILVLSADAEIEDKVLLLELGADDYVTKPFSPKELLARVRRAMRRAAQPDPIAPNPPVSSEVLVFGDARIDFASMEATRGGRNIALTSQEFKLLRFFANSPGTVVTRERLLNEAWGYESYPTTRTVDNYVLRLRQKFEPEPANPRYFLTVHGSGYKFVPKGTIDSPLEGSAS